MLPNFVIVGAPRCATTTLHYYLARHPQVRMSAIKEPNFFLFGSGGATSVAEPTIVRKSVRDRAEYEQLFGQPSAGERAVGEASPLYLYVREAAERILALCGAVPIVALVRHPVERAWSHFLHAFPELAGDDPEARFAELCAAEMRAGPGDAEPYRTRTHLLRLGRYGEQVRRYQDLFGADRVEVLVLEELEREPTRVAGELCAFLGIDRQPMTDDDHVNISGRRAAGWRVPVRLAVRRAQPVVKAVLPPRLAAPLARLRTRLDDRALQPLALEDHALRSRLLDWYADDIALLSSTTGLDLSHWVP